MEKSIVLIHSAIAILLLLYLLIRILAGLIGLRDRDYQEKIRARFRKTDWAFAVLLALSGAYPLLAPGQFELYHLVKILLLCAFIWLSRYANKFHFTAVSLVIVVLVIMAAYFSFTDQPRFPVRHGTFEASHPEIGELSPLEQGKFIFNTICSDCHGQDGKLGRFGAADLTVSKMSREEKIEIVTQGSPLTVMRSFSEELSANEISAVVNYIQSLAR